MKQGRASISGRHDQKIEPHAKAVNPGAVSYLGNKLGNHTTDKGTFPLQRTEWDAGRGYEAPKGVSTTHKNGSQGSY